MAVGHPKGRNAEEDGRAVAAAGGILQDLVRDEPHFGHTLHHSWMTVEVRAHRLAAVEIGSIS